MEQIPPLAWRHRPCRNEPPGRSFCETNNPEREGREGAEGAEVEGSSDGAGVPPVDEDAHQHQQTDDGERGDHGQRDDRPGLHLHGAHQAHPGLVAAVVAP